MKGRDEEGWDEEGGDEGGGYKSARGRCCCCQA
jgi:hypothetical protein